MAMSEIHTLPFVHVPREIHKAQHTLSHYVLHIPSLGVAFSQAPPVGPTYDFLSHMNFCWT